MSPHQLETATVAQARLAHDLLAWAEARPPAPQGLATRLLRAITDALAPDADAITSLAASRSRGVLVTKSGLGRLACDGLAVDYEPYVQTWANMRGVLAHAAIAEDWVQGRACEPATLVEELWQREASRRPGDPRSDSAWMNAQSSEDAAALRDEVADLLTAFREVWPPLPGELVDVQVERAIDVVLPGGAVRLFGRPDLVLGSRRDDDRARTIVVDLKTGRPRPEEDREELRFYALLVTLATGRAPFRWATFHVTDGRAEPEDLREVTLERAAQRVVDGVRQQLRVAAAVRDGDESGLRLQGGGWCHRCRRREDCPLSQASATLQA